MSGFLARAGFIGIGTLSVSHGLGPPDFSGPYLPHNVFVAVVRNATFAVPVISPAVALQTTAPALIRVHVLEPSVSVDVVADPNVSERLN